MPASGSYRDVLSWSPAVVKSGRFVLLSFRTCTVGVTPRHLVVGALDAGGILGERARPYKYAHYQTARFRSRRLGTIVELRGRRGLRLEVRFRAATADVLRTALRDAGVVIS